MKKLICLMMTAIMALVCAGGIAEGTGGSEEAPFLQIKEDVTARVYAEAGGAETADTLKGGSFCGLLESVTVSGNEWFRVFYLDSRKKAAVGFINGDDAVRLTMDELKKLLEDPEKANEILDLIDALNDFLKDQSQETGAGESANSSNSGSSKGNNFLQKLYDDGMEMLNSFFDSDFSQSLDQIGKMGEEVLGSLTEAGKEIVGGAVEGGKELIKKGGDILEENMPAVREGLEKLGQKIEEAAKSLKNLPEDAGKIIEEIIEKVKEAAESITDEEKTKDIREKIDEALKEIDASAGKGTGYAIRTLTAVTDKVATSIPGALESMSEKTGFLAEEINKLKTWMENWLNGNDYQNIQNYSNAAAIVYELFGFSNGTSTIKTAVKTFIDGFLNLNTEE